MIKTLLNATNNEFCFQLDSLLIKDEFLSQTIFQNLEDIQASTKALKLEKSSSTSILNYSKTAKSSFKSIKIRIHGLNSTSETNNFKEIESRKTSNPSKFYITSPSNSNKNQVAMALKKAFNKSEQSPSNLIIMHFISSSDVTSSQQLQLYLD